VWPNYVGLTSCESGLVAGLGNQLMQLGWAKTNGLHALQEQAEMGYWSGLHGKNEEGKGWAATRDLA
jgi:hypothetical protein